MDAIVILNFGGQYAHLIGRRVRENNVYSEVVPCDIELERLHRLKDEHKVKGIILSGGPFSVYDKDAPKCSPKILEMGLPILGICYGHQLIAHMVGGKVKPAERREYGVIRPKIVEKGGLLKGVETGEKAWTSHGDIVQKLPSDYRVTAKTKNCPIAAFALNENKIYGIQWHPEVAHTEYGDQIFQNFLFDICDCKPTWRMENFTEKAIRDIKNKVRESKCIVAMSGGIDSSTAAVLASRAVGENLIAVFVDHGFMREDEKEKIAETFKNFKMKLIVLDETERFLKALAGVVDPEEKREIIGEKFVRVFEEVAEDAGAEYLIQGTIYPDWIESGTENHSEKIKSHHNVGGMPTELEFKEVIEPLKNLYKDEVRQIAKSLGMPSKIVDQQPFPGPGLAVRIVGEVSQEKLRVLKRADAIFRKEVENEGLNNELWQYFAVLPGTGSTGVKGDSRAYGYTVALRAVESEEAMTASFAKLPYDFLERVSTKITNEIPEIIRVVYDITHKPPATIEWE